MPVAIDHKAMCQHPFIRRTSINGLRSKVRFETNLDVGLNLPNTYQQGWSAQDLGQAPKMRRARIKPYVERIRGFIIVLCFIANK